MKRRQSLALCLWLSLCPLCLGVEPVSLEARLAPLIKPHKGKVAVAVKQLGTNSVYYYSADEPMPAAGLMHLPLMLEVYQQAAEEKLRLTEAITLRAQDRVPGSGILAEHFSSGATFPLRDAVRVMIAFSDATAGNMVFGKVGGSAVNQRMEAWGLQHTRIKGKTAIEGTTTAREMVMLLEALEKGTHCPPAMKQAVLGHLKRCTARDGLARLLPAEMPIAQVTGSARQARNDAGILYLPNAAVALCVLTAENDEQGGHADNGLCGRVARAVYEHCAAGAGAAPAAQ
jgi:beta-lactamase class A